MSKDESEREFGTSATPEGEVQIPQCASTFHDVLSQTYGDDHDPRVDLPVADNDSLEGALSDRIEGLRSSSGTGQRYKLKGEIGRGGMGAILKIFDTDLRRHLAMKVVHERIVEERGSEATLESQPLMRFLEEAQVTGQLDHPGVVPVHELGVDPEGRVYFTMRLVRGEDLSKILAKVHAGDPEWSRTRVLGVLLKACEAMSYAHEKGVVHRDLKPANVMVGRHGAVYVMDWGLARVEGRLDSHDLRLQEQPVSLSIIKTDRRDSKNRQADSPLMTMDGDVMGTPFYMPPEQAAGRLQDIGPHSDVYGLGAMLYHLLTGRMPYHTPGDMASPYTVLAQVLSGPPQPIAELAPDVPPELVSICEKAMQPKPGDRYPDMGELAEDLRAFLENRVVQAHRSGAVIELKKWVQRNKALAAMILAFIGLSVGGSTTAALVLGAKNETIRVARDGAIAAQGLAEVAATNEKSQRELAQANERRAREAEAQALREAERATLAEAEAESRADELKQVANFQAEQIGALDVEVMGIRLRGALIDAAPAERREGVTHNLAGLNFTNLAIGTLKENLFDRTIEAIDAQFEGQPLVQAQLLQSVATTLMDLGFPSMATGPQSRGLSIRRTELGADHPVMLFSVSSMGSLLRSLGKFKDALPYSTEALEGMRRVLGDDHPNTLTSMNNMGAQLRSMGKHEEAMPFYVQALEGKRRVLGNDDPSTLISVNNLGALLRTMDRLEEAMPYYTEALGGMRRVLGGDHPETLNSVSNMGVLLNSMGKPEEALPYYTEALEGKRRVLGDSHQTTLSSVSNMGILLQSMNKFEEALPYLTEALEGFRHVLGDDHPNTLTGANNMGSLLYSMRKLKEALPYFTEALEGGRRNLGDSHPNTLRSVNSMGALLRSMGKLEEALPYCTEALEGRRRVLGDDNQRTLTSVSNMGSLLESMGKYEEALPYRTEAFEGSRGLLGGDHSRTIEYRGGLSGLYEAWVASLIKAHGEDHPLTLTTRRNQAIFFANSNQEEEAEALLLACLDKRLEHQGDAHPDTLQLFHDLATLYAKQGLSEESEGMYLECLALREEALGESHSMTLESLEGLARLYAKDERYEEATPLAERLLALTPKESLTLVERQGLLQLIESKLEK
ncbi:MAG: serine/threonine protein kinase/tetratricopeptide (TPR) repeat protein [Planctomycetota bacterium]|jgi:serine/threonine protein kinase/tetratricopeptide (TPR) repeat protein